MKTLGEFLREAREAPLYHGTTAPKAASILKSNMLAGSRWTRGVQGGPKSKWLDPDPKKDPLFHQYGENAVSLTRDLKYALTWAGPHGIVLQFDQSKLAQRYKFIPYNFWRGATRNADGNGQPFSESEERLIGDITPVNKYLTKVITPADWVVFKRWSKNKLPDVDYLRYHPLLFAQDTKQWLNHQS